MIILTFFVIRGNYITFLEAFREKCYNSKINSNTKHRYWIYKKSSRLDKLIEFYNEVKNKY